MSFGAVERSGEGFKTAVSAVFFKRKLQSARQCCFCGAGWSWSDPDEKRAAGVESAEKNGAG